jgi:hemin uptake protein HemP
VKENKDKQLDTKEIFDKEKVIKIKHEDQLYYLKITKANKLILTK